jgi:hypothetical protein
MDVDAVLSREEFFQNLNNCVYYHFKRGVSNRPENPLYLTPDFPLTKNY